MKRAVKIIFVFVFLPVLGQNFDQGIITYNARFSDQIDTTRAFQGLKNNRRDRFVKQETLKILRSAKDVTFTLKFRNGKSEFYQNISEEFGNDSQINLTKILAGSGKFFTNLKSQKMVWENDFFGEKFRIIMPKRKWILSGESKGFGNYIAFKATVIKKIKTANNEVNEWEIIAWYIPELPANFGPKEYWGLPGLIVELYEGKMIFMATEITLNPNKKLYIKEPSKGEQIQYHEYDEYTRSMSKSIRKVID